MLSFPWNSFNGIYLWKNFSLFWIKWFGQGRKEVLRYWSNCSGCHEKQIKKKQSRSRVNRYLIKEDQTRLI